MSRRTRLGLIVSALVVFFGLSAPAFAQQGKGGNGLSISPTRYDLTVEPGKSSDIKINIGNITGSNIVAKVTVNDFDADGVTGEPHIIVNQTQPSPQSISSFLSGVTDVPLDKGASQTVDITLKVPQNAAPGAYYGIIRYAAVRQDQTTPQGNNVSLTASVGVVVLLTVPGNIKEQIQLNRVAAYKDTVAKNSSSFFLKAPQAVGVDIKNLGNGFAQPFGNVNVTNMLGKQVYTYQLNTGTPRGVVLPNSSRTLKDVIKNVKLPGRYVITANVSYGTGGQVLVTSSSFWYMPVWIIVVLVVLLAVLIAVGYILYRRMSRRPAKLRRK